MTYLDPHELLQSQDTWKRSQVRLPNTLYHAIMEYADKNNMSLNTAIIELTNKGLLAEPIETDKLDLILKEIQSLKK